MDRTYCAGSGHDEPILPLEDSRRCVIYSVEFVLSAVVCDPLEIRQDRVGDMPIGRNHLAWSDS